ncbi:ATPase components of ABC transporters with duplicated ATPase domains [Loktanella atrilutea]|uniref:ATPase components of ABC transporters with duplicated ATPase domains n=1 Tax=Loktanella atrilutea TaxID=366533 RepID=A0A1M4ZVK5_LOKAT|nr:ABC-F family ATP-binding cassette domain-containing protein [Loktanella atrilutea]SHF21626.1 ATPase components of ABC transporters with duplicated ATPase domains [Loktanella atrilutea]
MTLIDIQSLGVTLGETLFTDLTLTIAKGDRIGLVAANGRGKSTLLGCIAGSIDPTQGEITRGRGLRIGHVGQHPMPGDFDLTLRDRVLHALPPDRAGEEAWRADVVLDDLQVPEELHHRRLSELSGGWQRTAMLAAAWVAEPDLLLLDEPTNHLDLHRIGLLQGWLAALPRSVPIVVTSHDRAFLDAVTNRTLFLRASDSRSFALPYTRARAALEESDAADARRFANDLNKANQLRRQAAKLKNIGINSGSDLLITKTKQLGARADRIEAAARPAHAERTAGEIRLAGSGSHARALVALEEVEVTTPDGRPLYRTGRMWIAPGDRVVLLGGNGTGKTQLVRLIHAATSEDIAGIRCASSIGLGYSDQHLSQLSPADTPMTAITARFDVGDSRARAMLAGAGVDIRLQDTKIAALSGGQRARLAMLILRLQQPNFYLLDEPTNHLDIDGQEALEEELARQDAACLLVSHDRQFLRAVGTRFWQITGRRLVEVDDPKRFLAGELAP